MSIIAFQNTNLLGGVDNEPSTSNAISTILFWQYGNGDKMAIKTVAETNSINTLSTFYWPKGRLAEFDRNDTHGQILLIYYKYKNTCLHICSINK